VGEDEGVVETTGSSDEDEASSGRIGVRMRMVKQGEAGVFSVIMLCKGIERRGG
jgi:hypothetical protein